MAEYDDIYNILKKNKDKSFVKRILEKDKYPVLNIGDNMIATHKMAWSDMEMPDGSIKYVVYPTILYDGKKLVDYGDAAYEMALNSGNYIEFDRSDMADWFSKRYKAYWGE